MAMPAQNALKVLSGAQQSINASTSVDKIQPFQPQQTPVLATLDTDCSEEAVKSAQATTLFQVDTVLLAQ